MHARGRVFDVFVRMKPEPVGVEQAAGIFMPRQTRFSVRRVPRIALRLSVLTFIAFFYVNRHTVKQWSSKSLLTILWTQKFGHMSTVLSRL